MIVLYTYGPFFGLPEGSPFATKAMLLLKMAGIEFKENRDGLMTAPKGKLPYIADEGELIADSTFIRFHIESKYGFDFDAGLTDEQKAVGWALERMCEEHLYWLMVADRWLDDSNYENGPARFFDSTPFPLKTLLKTVVRRKIRRDAKGQGLYRHSEAERAELAKRDLAAAAALLGDKPYLFGDSPHGADATLGAFLIGALCPEFNSVCRTAAEGHPDLVAYRDRILAAYFPQAD
ncbi:glutathione S-transferase family protein [Methylocapsa palsarum]|uniref:Glutathione S-transferase n=1 Tax=Methylocapsa palsarum TaxID=1612308 RepID=A0A1I3ZLY5_9HYPH|nr:glutathione S-transferase family protein [Methylocapsa palsarum]SFK45062.1 Glutathione S-transferase [Methylocapsa palsarum]